MASNTIGSLRLKDIFGNWDASLAFVMAGAIAISAPGFIFANRSLKPVLGAQFNIPDNQVINRQLLSGSATFGIGWGIVGLCPGPAIVALTGSIPEIVVFFAFMLAGLVIVKTIKSEPGIFSTYLIIALLINSKILKNKLFGYINIIFIVALITTLSTFGLIMMVFTLFFLFLDKSTINYKNKLHKYLTNFLALFFLFLMFQNYNTLILYLIELNPEIFYKLDLETDSISSGTRLFAPLFDFQMFQTSPIFGVGISQYYLLWDELSNDPKSIYNVGTSTLTYYLASFGLSFVFFFLYLIKKMLTFKSLNILFSYFLVFLTLIILFKEPHQNFLFCYIAFTYILLYKDE